MAKHRQRKIMRSIAFLSQKGGSGKTTLAVHVAVAACESKEKVVLVDTDPQGSAADWGAARKRAAIEGSPRIEKASAATLASAIERARNDRMTLAVIDMAPHATAGVDIIASAADFLLIPCRASAFDLRAIAARKPAAFILNACDARIPEVMEAKTVLARHGLQVAPIDIGQRVPFARAVASGLSVTEFDPRGKAAQEIGELWRWIKKQLESL
jgi:chromosome partitioning protein